MLNKKVLILVYALIVVPICWFYLSMSGMGAASEVSSKVSQDNLFLSILMKPFEFLFVLGFWGGLGVAIILLIIGVINSLKPWWSKLVIVGVWITILYLFGIVGYGLILTLVDLEKLMVWFLGQLIVVIPSILISYRILVSQKK